MSKELLDQPDSTFSNLNFKACFFDIDGTLVSSSGAPSGGVQDTILQIQKLGIKTCLVTGRPYFGAKQVISACNITHPSVFYSGALIIEPGAKTPIFEACLPKEAIFRLIEIFKSEQLHLELYTRDSWFVTAQGVFSNIHMHYLGAPPKVSELQPVIESEQILKIGLIAKRGEEEFRLRSVLANLPGFSTNTAYGAAHPEIVFGNVTSVESSRESAFEFLTKVLGVGPNETISFGDGESDVPFLALAGLGIAMANASQPAKEAADFVTKSVEDDGVPYALRRFFRLT